MKYDSMEDDELAYNDFLSELDRLINGNSTFRVKGRNVGWKNTNGEIEVSYSDAKKLMYDLTPNSQFTVELTDLGGGSFEIMLSHHDSPTGETHTFHPK